MVMPVSAKQELLRELPRIRRARDYYLYDASGRRFLDLYQDGGRAWLGHRPSGLSLQLKNTLSRGVYAPYPSPEEGKLLKAIQALALSRGAGHGVHAACYPGHEGPDAHLWRPGFPWPDPGVERMEILVPLPGIDYGRVLVSGRELPPAPLPSPLVAAALTRVLWTLKHALEEDSPGEYPDYSCPCWKQTGGYMEFTGRQEEYPRIFRKALSHGILISPECRAYSIILPRIMSPSDRKLLDIFFKEIQDCP